MATTEWFCEVCKTKKSKIPNSVQFHKMGCPAGLREVYKRYGVVVNEVN